MRFGIRDCTNIVFRAKTNMNIGTTTFKAGQPVLYIDSAKTSSLEGSGDSVYARGGRGNANLITWEGNKTQTFTMEDALISPLGMAILSGAGLLDNDGNNSEVHVHKTILQSVVGSSQYTYYIADTRTAETTYNKYVALDNTITNNEQLKNVLTTAVTTTAEGKLVDTFDGKLPKIGSEGKTEAINYLMASIEDVSVDPTGNNYTDGESTPILRMHTEGTDLTINVAPAMLQGETICAIAPLYVFKTEPDGSLTKDILTVSNISTNGTTGVHTITLDSSSDINQNDTVFVDFYAIAKQGTTKEIQIDAEHFAGYFYVEADTLFRRQIDGKDCPAIITLPNVKIQSNFTFTMSSDGDPSTFTFTMDVMPGYTYFNKNKKVLCVIQVIDNEASAESTWESVMRHYNGASHVSRHEDASEGYEDGTFIDSNITETPING